MEGIPGASVHWKKEKLQNDSKIRRCSFDFTILIDWSQKFALTSLRQIDGTDSFMIQMVYIYLPSQIRDFQGYFR